MFSILYRSLLTLNTIYIITVIYYLNNKIITGIIGSVILFIPPIIFTAISIYLSNNLSLNDVCSTKEHPTIISIKSMRYVSAIYGFILVLIGLSIGLGTNLLSIIILTISVIIYFNDAYIFNPFFLLFGYQVFKFKTINNVEFYVLTKKNIRRPNNIVLYDIKRITDSIYFDK